MLTRTHHLSLSWTISIHSNPSHPNRWRFILILYFHIRLGLRENLLTNAFQRFPILKCGKIYFHLVRKNIDLQFLNLVTKVLVKSAYFLSSYIPGCPTTGAHLHRGHEVYKWHQGHFYTGVNIFFELYRKKSLCFWFEVSKLSSFYSNKTSKSFFLEALANWKETMQLSCV